MHGARHVLAKINQRKNKETIALVIGFQKPGQPCEGPYATLIKNRRPSCVHKIIYTVAELGNPATGGIRRY